VFEGDSAKKETPKGLLSNIGNFISRFQVYLQQFQWLPYLDAAQGCFSPSNAEAILQLPRFASSAAGALGVTPWR
jgi:hypothetical protein